MQRLHILSDHMSHSATIFETAAGSVRAKLRDWSCSYAGLTETGDAIPILHHGHAGTPLLGPTPLRVLVVASPGADDFDADESIVSALTALLAAAERRGLQLAPSLLLVESFGWLEDYGYPPVGGYFDPAREGVVARYLWRAVTSLAPDLVLALRPASASGDFAMTTGQPRSWRVNRAVFSKLAAALDATPTRNGLLTALGLPGCEMQSSQPPSRARPLHADGMHNMIGFFAFPQISTAF
eukprot:SAG31_NODE_5_length_43735_cov_42.922266_3_plen_240_part_00